MSAALHKAIRDALAATPAYRERGILVSHVLDATGDVTGSDTDLYRAVHALFAHLPQRLVRGSLFMVATQDADDAVELSWDAREVPKEGYQPGQGLLAAYEDDEPIARALGDLETRCAMRAGYVRTTYEKFETSSSFEREPFLHRRVVAHLPYTPAFAEARAAARKRDAENLGAEVRFAEPAREKREWRTAPWPRPMVGLVARR